MSRYVTARVGSTGPHFVYAEGSRIRCQQSKFVRHAMSELYDTQAEANMVADWLTERDAGYPICERLVNAPIW